MATQSREPTVEEELEGGLLGQIEVHSIDWIPDTERHGKTWQQAMLWFLGNFQYFTIPIGFVGPALGLSLGWSILAGTLGIASARCLWPFTPPRVRCWAGPDDPDPGPARLPRRGRGAVRRAVHLHGL